MERDRFRNAKRTITDVGRGIGQQLGDICEGLSVIAMASDPEITVQRVYGECDPEIDAKVRGFQEGLLYTAQHPVRAAEGIGQTLQDRIDEEGLAYGIGYIGTDVTIGLATKKAFGGTSGVSAGKVADATGDAASAAGKLDDIVGTASVVNKVDDVADVVEDIEHVTNQTSDVSFKYEHNPSDNPVVLKDAIEDSSAVYGYRPREDGSLASFSNAEWDNPIAVERYRQDRIAYHNRNEGASRQIVSDMLQDGASIEDVARAVNEYRNQSRISAYIDAEGNIKNIEGYNAALNRVEMNSYENLIKSGKTPEQIIKSATKGNSAMDACTGLYDIYFWMY